MGVVTVLGSSNIDLVITTTALPKIGETVLGQDLNYFDGGKGCNQAVASARVGGHVQFVSAVGCDTFGDRIIQNLEKERISHQHVARIEGVATGVAAVLKVDSDNAIVVAPGANGLVTPDLYPDFKEMLAQSTVLLTQMEVPAATVKTGLKLAKDHGVITLLNPAPFTQECFDLLEFTDIVTPNETEFANLCGKMAITNEELEEEMLRFSRQRGITLVVTRGQDGVSYTTGETVETIPSILVEATDTTGAGDTFNGILATYLAREYSLDEAIKLASIGASISVTKFGAQTGMPTHEELKMYE